MTCIAGIVLSNGDIWIGCDSAGTNSSSQQEIRADAKVFFIRNDFNDEFLLGCTTSFRMIDLLKYTCLPPQYTGDDIHRYMVVEFVKTVRHCLSDGGFAKKQEEREQGGDFLIGFRGRLFRIASDYQVAEVQCDYQAIGSGDDLALGALFATRDEDPKARLTLALQAAAYHNSDVRAPFVIQRLPFVSPNAI